MLLTIYQSLTAGLHSIASDLAGGDGPAKGLIMVGLLGGVVALCRNVPRQIKTAFTSRFTVSIQTHNSWEGENRELYRAVSKFVSENQINRNFKVVNTIVDKLKGTSGVDILFGPQPSSGWFFHKGNLFKYAMMEASEQGAIPENITVSAFGRKPSVILDAVGAAEFINKNYADRKFYESNKGEWEIVSKVNNSTPIFLDPELKRKIDSRLDFFIKNEQWYIDRGISHKLLVVLEGPPGCGKSRLSRYIADQLRYSLGTITSPSGFVKLARDAAGRNIVVSVPDVDAVGIGSARRGFKSTSSQKAPRNQDSDMAFDSKTGEAIEPDETFDSSSAELSSLESFLTKDCAISDVLNLFQGDIPVNNLVCVMSTNKIEDLDSALTRPGRCDLKLHVGPMKSQQVNDFRKYYYSVTDDIDSSYACIQIRACDIMEGFMLNPTDVTGFDLYLQQFKEGDYYE